MSAVETDYWPSYRYTDPKTTLDRYRAAIEDRTAVHLLDMEFPTLASELGGDLRLASVDENLTGSFKIRGALHAMRTYKQVYGVESVVVPSAGNFARGAALAGKLLDMTVTIVVPNDAPHKKKDGINEMWPGGRLRVVAEGASFDESLIYARQLSQKDGRVLLHPYDDEYVMEGQGTIVDDMLAEAPDTTHIIFPSGGGGLGAGMAARLAELGRSDVMLHPVEAEGSDSLSKSLRLANGEVVEATEPNRRYGGSAVRKCGKKCLETYLWAGYGWQDVTQVSDSEVEALAETYIQDRHELLLDNIDPYEPTTLVAVAGLARLVRQGHVQGSAVVLGTGHNAPIEHTFIPETERSRGMRIASAQVPLRPLIHPR